MRVILNSMCAAVLPLLAAAVAAQEPSTPVTGDVGNGEKVYVDHGCYSCHGFDGIGRRKMLGSASGVFRTESRSLTYIANGVSGVMASEDVFIIYLRARANSNPEFPAQSMPYYPESSLSDDDARDLYAYIMTFVDDPPPVEDIPALRAILESAEQ